MKRMKKVIPILITTVALSAGALRAEDGKTIYERDCAKCHGADGKGDTKMGKKTGAKDYSDAKVQDALKDDAAFKAIKEGLKDKEGKTLMKPSEGISDEEIKGVVAYLRTFKK
jgi:mono/diheme cytochrome c family protein